jgi:hypothetical protein
MCIGYGSFRLAKVMGELRPSAGPVDLHPQA